MRGGPPTSAVFLPGHAISISVSEPQKIRKWLFARVVYHISTKIGSNSVDGVENNPSSNYSVTREYSEIVSLYNKLRGAENLKTSKH